MENDLSREARPGTTRWNKGHTAYRCADGINVFTPGKIVGQD